MNEGTEKRVEFIVLSIHPSSMAVSIVRLSRLAVVINAVVAR